MTSVAPALIVYYCAPFAARIVALDITREALRGHNGFAARLSRGAFNPRALHLARPDIFRPASPSEVRALRVDGSEPHYVHSWCVWSPVLAASVDTDTVASEVQA